MIRKGIDTPNWINKGAKGSKKCNILLKIVLTCLQAVEPLSEELHMIKTKKLQNYLRG